jgi:hypothetical protein
MELCPANDTVLLPLASLNLVRINDSRHCTVFIGA